jgi:hypothetical protein
VVDFWACAFIGVRWAHRSAGLAREDRWAPRGGREHQLLPSPCGARRQWDEASDGVPLGTSVVMTRMDDGMILPLGITLYSVFG